MSVTSDADGASQIGTWEEAARLKNVENWVGAGEVDDTRHTKRDALSGVMSSAGFDQRLKTWHSHRKRCSPASRRQLLQNKHEQKKVKQQELRNKNVSSLKDLGIAASRKIRRRWIRILFDSSGHMPNGCR
jgi:hypothetical protein